MSTQFSFIFSPAKGCSLYTHIHEKVTVFTTRSKIDIITQIAQVIDAFLKRIFYNKILIFIGRQHIWKWKLRTGISINGREFQLKFVESSFPRLIINCNVITILGSETATLWMILCFVFVVLFTISVSVLIAFWKDYKCYKCIFEFQGMEYLHAKKVELGRLCSRNVFLESKVKIGMTDYIHKHKPIVK